MAATDMALPKARLRPTRLWLGATLGLLMLLSGVAVIRWSDIPEAAAAWDEQMRLARQEGLVVDPATLEQQGADYTAVLKPFENSRYTDATTVAANTGSWLIRGSLSKQQVESGMRALRQLEPNLAEARELARQPTVRIDASQTSSLQQSHLHALVLSLIASDLLRHDGSCVDAAGVINHLKQYPDLAQVWRAAELEKQLLLVLPRLPRREGLEVLDILNRPVHLRAAVIGSFAREREMLGFWIEDNPIRYVPGARKANETRLVERWRSVAKAVGDESDALTKVEKRVARVSSTTIPSTHSYWYVRWAASANFMAPFSQLRINEEKRRQLREQIEVKK